MQCIRGSQFIIPICRFCREGRCAGRVITVITTETVLLFTFWYSRSFFFCRKRRAAHGSRVIERKVITRLQQPGKTYGHYFEICPTWVLFKIASRKIGRVGYNGSHNRLFFHLIYIFEAWEGTGYPDCSFVSTELLTSFLISIKQQGRLIIFYLVKKIS